MKTQNFKLLVVLIFVFNLQILSNAGFAQSPQKMTYQAVIRNTADKLVTNQSIGMKISILQGSKAGTAVYQETYSPLPQTNSNGLVTVEIGSGNPISGAFSNIDWSNGIYFIKTETDPSGGTNYSINGISQLLSVPFALHAKTVEIDNVNDADADPTNEIQTISLNGNNLTLSKAGGTVILPSSGGGDNWGGQTAATDATLSGNGTATSPLTIAQQLAVSGQVLKWNGTSWLPGNDVAGESGLTLPYSQTVAANDFAFSVTNSLNSAIKGISTSTDSWGIDGEAPRFGIKGKGGDIGVYGEGSYMYSIGVQGVGERYGIFGKGFYGVLGGSTEFEGCGVYGTAQNCGVKGEASSDSGLGLLGVASSTTGKTYGLKGHSSSLEGFGVYGEAPNIGVKGVGGNMGVSGESSGMGIGVHGVAPIYGVFGEGSYAVYGSSTTEGGYGVFGTSISCGVRGFSSSETGVGVMGNNASGSGYTYGVKGLADSENGTGVYGDGGQYGVYGESKATNGTGVYGVAASYGVNGTSTSSFGAGVRGWGAKYGVYGECPVPTGYAGYFSGNLAVTGNIGIGINDPGYRLDVAGAINLDNGTTGGAIYCNGKEALWSDGNFFSWGYQSQYNYFARSVAIGTNNYPGTNMLVVNGTAAKPGGGTWATWSDIRLKDIHGNYEKGLKEIISLKAVKYTYKVGNACNLPSDQNYVGFVAQEVRKIFPEAVSEGKDGYLNLDVNSINVALVNAVKELKAENDRLKAENENFNSRLNSLEKLIRK